MNDSYLKESDDIRREIAIAKNMIRKCEDRLDALNLSSEKIFDVVNILTAREHQVYLLIRAGLTGEKIAEKLSLSARTVEVFSSSILIKLRCKNRTELLSVKDLSKISYEEYH